MEKFKRELIEQDHSNFCPTDLACPYCGDTKYQHYLVQQPKLASYKEPRTTLL